MKNKTVINTALEQLKVLRAGKNYPAYTKVMEVDGTVVEFNCNSFYVGMYCAIYINGKLASQSGDRNNKGFVLKLIKDLKKAILRGAKVEICDIRNCKLEIPS